MQRLILIGAVLAMILLGSGGAYYMHRKNLPAQQWVPMPLQAGTPKEQSEKMVADLEKIIRQPDFLKSVVTELGLISKLKASDESTAVTDLNSRVFIKLGEHKDPMSSMKVDAILIGCNGKRKEIEMIGEISMKVGEKIRKALNIPEPQASKF